MGQSTADLPDDIEALKALVLKGRAEADAAMAAVAAAQARASDDAALIAHLKLQIAKL